MKPETKNPRGRPRFRPTAEQRALVIALIGAGLSVEEVAANVTNPGTGKPVSHVTLRRAFRNELRDGQARYKGFIVAKHAQLIRSRDEKVASSNVQFALRHRLGWREATSVEITGPDGAPLFGPDATDEEKLAAMMLEFFGHPEHGRIRARAFVAGLLRVAYGDEAAESYLVAGLARVGIVLESVLTNTPAPPTLPAPPEAPAVPPSEPGAVEDSGAAGEPRHGPVRTPRTDPRAPAASKRPPEPWVRQFEPDDPGVKF